MIISMKLNYPSFIIVRVVIKWPTRDLFQRVCMDQRRGFVYTENLRRYISFVAEDI